MDTNRRTELKSFYPLPFTSWGTMETTESTPLTSGDLTVGNIYFISKNGDANTSFDGAVTNKYGEVFTATGTNATWNGAELVDITNGKPTEIGFFYGNPLTMQFQWKLTYNSDGDCLGTSVSAPNGQPISRF